MKLFPLFALFLLLITVSGCRTQSLERTPQRRSIPARRPSSASGQRPAAQRQRQSDTALFDLIFHRNPQDFSADSHLSEAERAALRQSDASQDPAVRDLRQRDSRSQGERSDWVFGTRNGSYF